MNTSDKWILFIAEGFGSGRLRPGPGTWGSSLGLGLTVLLLQLTPPWFGVISIALVAVSVPLCGAGERILRKADPGSIVLDEIVAMPLVFFPLVLQSYKSGHSLGYLTNPIQAWPWWVAGFVLFRTLDIWKPWPIRPFQYLHGGLGVVADDVVAALIAGLILMAAFVISTMLRV